MSIPPSAKKSDNHSSLNFLFTHPSRGNSLEKQNPIIAPSAESRNSSFEYVANAAKKTNARHCDEMKIYFLDHYLEFLTYLDERKKRTGKIQEEMSMLDNEMEKQVMWREHCDRERMSLRKRRTRIHPRNFLSIKQIGQGGYGQVFLARKKDTQELCALKKMSKRLLCKLGETQHILTERDILTRTDSPWLVKLLYAFQDFEHVYLVMEYVPGGDLRTLLNASGILHDHHAKFYFAEMCAAVFALHKLGYLHRDLKPENFLLDVKGHIKLTDFGLSRGRLSREVVNQLRKKLEIIKSGNLNIQTVNQRFNTYQTMRKETRAFSIVGSPDYMAIEILTSNDEGYNHSVDYWSLGCILFEIVCGYPPFTAPTTDKVWINLYNWKTVLERPVYEGEDEEFNLNDDCWNLITRLITEPKKRFNCPEQITTHAYLKGINLEQLRGAYAVPLVPKLNSELDTAYFDDFSDPKDMALYADIKRKESDNEKRANMLNGQIPHSAFVGFTYKHKN